MHINNLVETVNIRLKHLSILISELAKTNVPAKASSSFKGGENINTKIQRRDFLSKQAQITSHWITETPLQKDLSGIPFANTIKSSIKIKDYTHQSLSGVSR